MDYKFETPPAEEVTVKCNECGEIYCFYPDTVVYLQPCKCGNGDWGRPIEWKDNKFGMFTFVERNIVRYQI